MKCNFLLLLVAVLVYSFPLMAQQLPYPPSTLIKSVSWETDTVYQHGPGSDQWPMTWARDGNLYAAWGDGWGWSQGDEPKRSIGITRIEGEPPNLTGEDLWGEGPGQNYGKPEALIAFSGKLYMFWTNGDSKYEHDSFSAISKDMGKNWELGDERLFKYAPAGFRVRGICQFGKGYQGAPDDFLYIYFGLNRHPDLYLARVRKEDIFDAAAYEWFVYLDAIGNPYWTSDFARKGTVFHDNNAYLWHISVAYNPGLDRFFLTKPHFTSGDAPNQVRAPNTHISSLGIFDAPKPWGPWTTVHYEKDFLDPFVKFNFFIPPKFISADGRDFWMGWSGWPEYDNVNFIKGRFEME